MIYRVTIPNFEHFVEGLQATLTTNLPRLAQWGFGKNPSIGRSVDMVSAPMTRLQLDQVAAILTQEGVGWTSQDISDQYLHVVTTAPETYDYPGTCIALPIAREKNQFGKEERHVAIQKERQEYQFGRYASGLHAYRIIAS